ncbi:MAG: TRAP transporter large permease [Desulfotignum sp.]|nr:TRAP transporter large permease [Desulfotignum sp.]MCF8088584.1 TRAP transporter large permease [Desulfotignum sp.]MCF8136572.1 TRAP transporter large permease [Desulfotignum sp.]
MLETGILIGIVLMFILFFIGAPVFISIGIASVSMIIFSGSYELLPNIGQCSFEGLNSFAFLSIPLYILTGDIISETGVTEDLLNFADALVGGIKGGVSASVIIACSFFAAISGSVASDAAVFSRLTIPEMVKRGYPKAYAGALVAAGGSTAVLIPPSVGYILIGSVLGVSIGDLFLATILPGILVVIMMLIVNYIYVSINGFDADVSGKVFSFSNMYKKFWAAKIGFAFPVIILGGIYSGIFTPSEAGAIAVAVGSLHGLFTGKLTMKSYIKVLRSSAMICGIVMPILAVAYLMGQTMTYFETQKLVFEAFMSITTNKYLLLTIIFILVVTFGMFIDLVPNILILGPLLLPVATKVIGMAPEHFCIWFMFTLSFGFITPPYGFNLFVVSGAADVPVMALARKMVPFLLAFLITNIIIALWPWLSLCII